MKPLDEVKKRVDCKKDRYFKMAVKAVEARTCDITASVVCGKVSIKCTGENYGYSFDIDTMKDIIDEAYENNESITGGK